MRRVMMSFLLVLLASTSLQAAFCARDVVPAATLLVPYVVVQMQGDVPDRTGTTTILHVTNTGSQATLVQLVVWNAVGEPAVTITAALSGYDLWTVDFADLLEGTWSRFDTSRSTVAPPNIDKPGGYVRTPFEWGPDGRSYVLREDPVRAPYSDPWPRGLAIPGKTSELPGGACGMPYGDAAGQAVAKVLVDKLQDPLWDREHRGCGELYVARHMNDWLYGLTANPLFFYATVHAVRSCSSLTAADPNFSAQVASDSNVLLGDVEYVNPTTGTLEMTSAVHLESAVAPAEVAAVGPFEAVFGVEDRREPLPTGFAFHYDDTSWSPNVDQASSALMLWKPFVELAADGKVADCGPYMYYAWDEDEHVFSRACFDCMGTYDIDPNLFPFATQLVPLTRAHFDLPGTAGWVLLLLPPSYAGFTQDPTPGDPANNPRYQGVAAVRTSFVLSGRAAPAWTEAAVTGNALCPAGGGQ
jgi:hypothetical protein